MDRLGDGDDVALELGGDPGGDGARPGQLRSGMLHPMRPIARLRMLSRALGLVVRGATGARVLTWALSTTALGAISRQEREWIGRIERRRRELAADTTYTRPSFGARLQVEWAAGVDKPLPVSETSVSMSIPPLECRLLMRLVRTLRPRSCVELGTGFGISSAYQGAALEMNGGGTLVTLDAAAAWAGIARQGFSGLGLDDNIELRLGSIDEMLGEVLEAAAPIDYALLDADHTERATLRHFEALLPHLPEGAIVVLDDIGWTAEMRRAWERVRRHERVARGVAIGRLGATLISR